MQNKKYIMSLRYMIRFSLLAICYSLFSVCCCHGWTDALSSTVPIRYIHVKELRQAVDTRINACGTHTNFTGWTNSWTANDIQAGVLIRACHINDLRRAVENIIANTAASRAAQSKNCNNKAYWGDATITWTVGESVTAGQTLISKTHINQLRTVIIDIKVSSCCGDGTCQWWKEYAMDAGCGGLDGSRPSGSDLACNSDCPVCGCGNGVCNGHWSGCEEDCGQNAGLTNCSASDCPYNTLGNHCWEEGEDCGDNSWEACENGSFCCDPNCVANCTGCQSCQSGSCQDDDGECSGCQSCSGGTCADNEANCTGECDNCSDGTCIDNDGLCNGCESCSGGTCADNDANCTGECDACSNAACVDVEALCTGNCDDCSNGSCVNDNGQCSGCQSCVSGNCADDDSNCSSGCCTTCSGGSCVPNDGECTDPQTCNGSCECVD